MAKTIKGVELGLSASKGHRTAEPQPLKYIIRIQNEGDVAAIELTKDQLNRLRVQIMELGRNGIDGESATIGETDGLASVTCGVVVAESVTTTGEVPNE